MDGAGSGAADVTTIYCCIDASQFAIWLTVAFIATLLGLVLSLAAAFRGARVPRDDESPRA